MIQRLTAWALLALVVWAAVRYGSHWHSPWAMPSNPVLSSLPAAGVGCLEKCK